MGCNRNSDCSRIARTVYPKLREDINRSIQTVNSELSETVDTLSALTIPEDYLGVKVKEKVDEIITLFTSDMNEVQLTKGNINTFINNKIVEHEGHYSAWKRAQEEKTTPINNTEAAVIE